MHFIPLLKRYIFVLLLHLQLLKQSQMENILRPSEAELSDHENKSAHFSHKSQVEVPELQRILEIKKLSVVNFEQIKDIEGVVESKLNLFDENTLFIIEALGMFIFTFGQLCTKSMGIHFQISLLLFTAIPLCGTISGANFNTSVTLGFGLSDFNRYKWSICWLYFKTHFYVTFIAQVLAYYLNNQYVFGPLLPTQEVTVNSIVLSQFIGSYALVFFILLICDKRTSPTRDSEPIASLLFIVLLVYVGRRFAVVSYCAVNPAMTLAQGVFRVFVDSSTEHLKNSVFFVIGDFLGAIAAAYTQRAIGHIKVNLINADSTKQRMQSMLQSQTEMKEMQYRHK